METRTSGVPAPAPHELRRDRLLEVLHKHRARPLIVLAAPVGFGKSTLAAAYARESGGAVAWLTLQASDRDPRRLFPRLADALDAGFGEPGWTRQVRFGLKDGADGVGLARLLLDDLAQAPAGFIVVLDDFHRLDDADEAISAIDALIRDLPEAGQIVITSRTAPGLSMTRYVARGAVFAFGTDDLRFDDGETVELRAILGGDNSRDAQAEGWVAGILLGGAPRQLGVAGASLLAGYVEEEILARLSAEERSWLESLSVFETITPHIAEAVLGDQPWAARLLSLSERCPFLVRGEDGTYRLHALIREIVYFRLSRSPGSRARHAWSVARRLAEEANDPVGVVRACEESGQIDEAVEILRRLVMEDVKKGRWQVVLVTLQLLQERVRLQHPDLLLIEARACFNTGHAARAQDVAERALQHGGRSGDEYIQICALLELATATFTSNTDASEDWLTAADHLLRTCSLPTPRQRLLEGRALELHGILSTLAGDVAAAREAFENGERVLKLLGPSRELALLQQNLGSFCNRVGDYARALDALASAAAFWRLAGDSVGRATSQTILGDLQLRLGNFEAAGAALGDARAAARSVGSLRMEGWAVESLGQWHRANGRIDEAVAAFDESIYLAEQAVERELLTEVLVYRAEVALLQHDLQKARELLAHAQIEGQQVGSSAALAIVDRARGRFHLEEGPTSDAVEHLQRALERAGDTWGPDQKAETLYWLGTAHQKLKHAQPARNCLEQALDIVRKTSLPSLLAGPAAEDATLLRFGQQLGVEPRTLGDIERLSATRRPWTGIRRQLVLETAAANALPRIEVQLFGSFLLHRDGELVKKNARKIDRASELAALLVLHPEGLSGEAIAEMMFPDKPTEAAQHNLQMAAYALRKDLGKLAVRFGAQVYQLDPRIELVADVLEFNTALSDARNALGGARIDLLGRAVELYKDPLLAGAAWDWLDEVRAEYRNRYAGAALQLAELLAPVDVGRSNALAEGVLAIASETELAYERLILNGIAQRDTNAVRRWWKAYEQAAIQFEFVANPHLLDGAASRFAR